MYKNHEARKKKTFMSGSVKMLSNPASEVCLATVHFGDCFRSKCLGVFRLIVCLLNQFWTLTRVVVYNLFMILVPISCKRQYSVLVFVRWTVDYLWTFCENTF